MATAAHPLHGVESIKKHGAKGNKEASISMA